MENRRVVLTGLGAITPIGKTVDETWEGIKSKKCGIDEIKLFDASDYKTKLDAEVKKAMEKVCKEMGLSMSAAFTIFAKKVGREHRIPFEISADPFYSEQNIARLKKSIEQMETTGGTVHEVDYND